MKHLNGSASTVETPPDEIAAALAVARQQAHEQRLAVEQLLAEARAVEERLARETRQAQMLAERAHAREHAAAAIAAAQAEREAMAAVEACASTVAELGQRRAAMETATAGMHVALDSARQSVRELEQQLYAAREAVTRGEQRLVDADAQRRALDAGEAAAHARAAAAADVLAQQRASRQRHESESQEAEERARAFGDGLDTECEPSLEPVEELRLLEARVALRAEAAKRAAERRAADAARNHAVH